MKIVADKMGIDIHEVIRAAATKPFGFVPYYPGPGIGGHCIPIDPFYLSWKTKQAGIEARFIELAGYINGQMPHFVVTKVQNALNDVGKPVKGSNVHIYGVSYKRDIDDVRESPALDIIHLLQKRGAFISFSDPHVSEIRLQDETLLAVDAAALQTADCVVIVTDHSAFDYKALVDKAKLIVDTRNALTGFESDKIVRL
jgi:UDP-N-acetyl-D-glucosamine dehydrogenase